MLTLILVLLLVTAIFAVTQVEDRRFARKTRHEIGTLLAGVPDVPTGVFSHATLTNCPDPIRNYVKRCVPDGYPSIQTARLTQRGVMRTAPEQPWKPFTAEQHLSVNPPGFIWWAKLEFLPLVWIRARDRYTNGRGNMHIKLLSTVSVADATGSQIDSASLIRLVSEFMWLPTALVQAPYIHWQQVDANAATACIKDGDVAAAVTFHFGTNGDITLVEASRYMNADDAAPTPWCGRVTAYGEFNGVRMPTEVEVGWHLPEGYFAYWRGTVTDVAFNGAKQ